MTYKPVQPGKAVLLDRRHRGPDAPSTALHRPRFETFNTGPDACTCVGRGSQIFGESQCVP